MIKREHGTLHIYSPYQWHDEAFIVGTREALTALRDAIAEALSGAEGSAASLSFAADGEGFATPSREPQQED